MTDALKSAREALGTCTNPEGPEFLEWIANRLVNFYGVPEQTDFIRALMRKAQKEREALAAIAQHEAEQRQAEQFYSVEDCLKAERKWIDQAKQEWFETLAQDRKGSSAPAQPQAGGLDEREAFELAYAKQWKQADPITCERHSIEYLCEMVKSMRDGDSYWADKTFLNAKWEGWQARAALSQGGRDADE